MTRKSLKPEPFDVQGVCITDGCGNKQSLRIRGKYRPYCHSCYNKRFNYCPKGKIEYQRFRKNVCEECGFIPVHICQLDVDHIDGNHFNNNESNLKTLCANCHRLKTNLNRDWSS